MNILLLTPYAERLEPIFRALELTGDTATIVARELEFAYDYGADFIISYGYRHIVPELWLLKCRSINLHISYLPYNRGCAPNLWAWYEGTPHGVTIHELDKGIDTGPILVRRKVDMCVGEHTLASSYECLHTQMGQLFFDHWPSIRNGRLQAFPQAGKTSYNNRRDSERLLNKFLARYDTPCDVVQAAGEKRREAV